MQFSFEPSTSKRILIHANNTSSSALSSVLNDISLFDTIMVKRYPKYTQNLNKT